MSNVKSIKMTILEGNFYDETHAYAFAAYAENELKRRYPGADITVELVINTSGCGPRPQVFVDGDDWRFEDMVIDECDRLGEDWERAGWPGFDVNTDA